VQLQDSRVFTIAVSKSCCPVCWDIVTIFNEQTQEQGSDSEPVRFNTRGRHCTLYPVDLPDFLDEGVKDELVRKFSIDLLKDLFSLLDEDAKATKPKHAHSRSDVSQPESVAFSLNSSLGGSVDIDPSWATHKDVHDYHRSEADREFNSGRMKSWRISSSSHDLSDQPKPSQ